MLRLILVTISLSMMTSSAFAGVVATQFIEKEIIVRGADGAEQRERIVADKVAPGEEVIYSLRFSNDAEDAAEAVVLVMPVPGQVSYVEGSVTGNDAKVFFSADNGQTYVARGRLTVVENGVERPAKGHEITHIKWTLQSPLAAGAAGEISYRGVLN